MKQSSKFQAQNPLILRFHRLMEAFSKSDDERDFYLDKNEGFLLHIDLDKSQAEIDSIEKELDAYPTKYCLVPKLTYYETKKFMEGFVNEKVYDIDTKEKLLDIIGSKESRENFLEFIYDHLTELDKWQQYYHERSRIRIIEWLRLHEVRFVFEEDVEIAKPVMEKLKTHTFDAKVSKDVASARNALEAKAKTYYSNEALNPRPKRGRPPKQTAKVEVEPELVPDMYTTVPSCARPFLFIPDYDSTAVTFSAKFDTEEELLASLRGSSKEKVDVRLEMLSQRLESLRHLSGRLSSFQDVDIGEEKRLFKELSGMQSPEDLKEDNKDVSEIAKGLLPKKRGRPRKDETEKQRKVKKVTQIQYRSKKKK